MEEEENKKRKRKERENKERKRTYRHKQTLPIILPLHSNPHYTNNGLDLPDLQLQNETRLLIRLLILRRSQVKDDMGVGMVGALEHFRHPPPVGLVVYLVQGEFVPERPFRF